MLDSKQLADLDEAERDLNNKQTSLNTAIDTQVLLRLLVDKDITSKNEVAAYREEVKKSPKYRNAQIYIDQTKAEIQKYRNDPQAQLKRIFDDKLKGR